MGKEAQFDKSNQKLRKISYELCAERDEARSIKRVIPIGKSYLKVNDKVEKRYKYTLTDVPADRIRAIVRADGSIVQIIDLQTTTQDAIDKLLRSPKNGVMGQQVDNSEISPIMREHPQYH